jgi:hypothetical protein
MRGKAPARRVLGCCGCLLCRVCSTRADFSRAHGTYHDTNDDFFPKSSYCPIIYCMLLRSRYIYTGGFTPSSSKQSRGRVKRESWAAVGDQPLLAACVLAASRASTRSTASFACAACVCSVRVQHAWAATSPMIASLPHLRRFHDVGDTFGWQPKRKGGQGRE